MAIMKVSQHKCSELAQILSSAVKPDSSNPIPQFAGVKECDSSHLLLAPVMIYISFSTYHIYMHRIYLQKCV